MPQVSRDVSHLPLSRLAYRIMERLGLPGLHFVYGPYLDLYGATVFPKHNIEMLTVAPGVGLQDAYFNLQAPITFEEGLSWATK